MQDDSQYAPILVIGYNRVQHLEQTLFALSKNKESKLSKVYFFIDGPKNEFDSSQQLGILECIKKYSIKFRDIEINLRKYNVGLAENIISAITYVLERHDKIIVLEDDMVTSYKFLSFMNQALFLYQDNPLVWHISGYNEINDPSIANNVYFTRLMKCSGGWGTWRSRWAYFEKDPQAMLDNFDSLGIREFDVGGRGKFWGQVVRNARGELDTWAIFWYASIFAHQGLCLCPHFSYVQNIGFDGSGENSGYAPNRGGPNVLNSSGHFIAPAIVKEDMVMFHELERYYGRRNFFDRIKRLKNYLFTNMYN